MLFLVSDSMNYIDNYIIMLDVTNGINSSTVSKMSLWCELEWVKKCHDKVDH